MDENDIQTEKERYIGSVRFYKNMILLAVIIFITVPTVLFVHFWRLSERRAQELAQYAGGDEVPQSVQDGQTEQQTERQEAEPLSYQTLYPDFYAPGPMPEAVSEPRTMYLTFDDGPSGSTEEILSILEEKDVKATFFVASRGGEAEVEQMKQIAAQGHTLGLHSWSHDYHTIYDSVEAFLEDYYQLFTLLRDEVGVTPTVFRFPGGSINGYNRGVYQEIVAEMLRRGFVYYDWNLSAEDAANVSPSREEILDNVLGSSSRRTRGFVLMHDSDHCKTTVQALPEMIDGMREQGFVFQPIDRTVKPVIFNYKDLQIK